MKGQRYYTKEQEELIVELYVNQRRGQAYVCKKVGTTPKVLKKFLTANGYKIRNFSEAATASNANRAKHKKEDYFQTESANMAWLLGFLASDGCVRKDKNEIKIGLSAVDAEILEKIRQELELETSISYYTTTQGFKCASLTWTCAQHKRDLATYGIIPNKIFNLIPPYSLSKQYWIDYIRGYFDGDGSVNLIQEKSLRWQIGSATPEILHFIVDFFEEEYGIKKVNVQKQKNFYCIQYSTNATKKIHNILYTENSLYLARKKKHFDDIDPHEATISQ